MRMTYNPNNYTRCERCKHIDRENEKCKITNDNWLVSDKAGTCHQFEGVESMKVIPINNIRGAYRLAASCDKEYDVVREEGDRFVIINDQKEEKAYYKSWFKVIEDENKDAKLEKSMSRIDLVLNTDDFLESAYAQDVVECRCPSEFGLKEYKGEKCNSMDSACCSKCWNEPATKVEIERLLPGDKIKKLEENPHENLTNEFEENVKKGAEMLVKCSMSGEELFNNPIKPNHYQAGEFDVIAFCFKHNLDFATGNIIKYVTRAGKKDKDKTLEDLYKGLEYLERRIKFIESKEQG